MAKAKKEQEKITKLTPEQEAAIPDWNAKWLKVIMSCERIDEEKIKGIIKELYKAAELAEPKVYCSLSPFATSFAGALAAGMIYLRKITHEPMDKSQKTEDDRLNNLGAKDALEEAFQALMEPAVDEAIRACVGEDEDKESEATLKAETMRVLAEVIGRFDSGCSQDERASASYQKGYKEASQEAKEQRDNVARFLGSCISNFSRMYHGGNHWGAWCCFLSFWRDVVGLELDVFEKYWWYEQSVIHGGPRVVHQDFCIVSDRPTELHTVEQNGRHVPHNPKGPAIAWRDGWKLYYLNNVRVPKWLACTPAEQLDPRRMTSIANAEVRREFVRKVGIDRICFSLGAKTIDKGSRMINGQEHKYELVLLDIGDNRAPRPYLKMENPSLPGVYHVEGVPPDTTTVEAALAWRDDDKDAPLMLT